MRKIYSLLMVVILFTIHLQSSAQVSGTAFKDFNFNGTQQTSGFPTEPGAFGIIVKAYNSANVQVGPTKTTDVSGAYNFTAGEIGAGIAIRIEFTAPAGAFSAKSGAGNASDVQFATTPATNINYAIANQDWYSNTANPYVATNGATNGDANTSGAGSPGVNPNLYIFPYNMGNGAGTADDGGATRRLPNSQLGAIFGLAFQKTSRTLFMAAYLKRHTGFGPGGIGGIYKSSVDATGVPGAATLLVNVNAIGLNVGTDPHTGLPATSITRNADPNTFAQVGKTGIGGIDVSDDGKDLYFVNMFEKKLQRINIGNPLKATITAADVTGSWTITDPSSGGLVWHPMACKTANGKVYVGGVLVLEKTTAHNLATDTVGARGIVYEFNPATAVFTEVLRYPINYRRGYSNNDFRYPTKDNWWCGWQNNGGGLATDPLQSDYNTGNGTFTGGIYYPQPMMSNIEFDVDGSMILGIRDRFGDQMGYQNVSTDNLPGAGGFAGSANNFFRALTSGEVLRAGKNLTGVAYALETRGQSTNLGVTTGTLDNDAPGNPAVGGNWTTATGDPFGGFFGPGWGGTAGTIPPGGPNPGTQGGYFYFNHNYTTTGTGTNGVGVATTINPTAGAAINSHYLKSNGGVGVLAGSNEVIHTLMDPVNTAYSNGVSRMINSGTNAGTMAQRLELAFTTTGAPGNPTNHGKANAIGDIEILTDYQPIEIGNRIWLDANGNGIQDAGETTAGVPNGTTVTLRSPGVNGIYGDGDDQTWTTTTNATGNYYFSALSSADNRKPASWTGVVGNIILPGFDYRIEVAVPSGNQITKTNIAANSVDNIDNDATLNGANAIVAFNTSNTSHNFDIGFKTLATLGDRVWRDDNKNGTQDAGEPGVAGVTVTLKDNGGTVIASTITDAYGNYLFDNLTAASYTVTFTLPANYIFTTQTNTTDDNNTTGASTTGSDANVVTGQTYTIVLSAGENNRNIDAGIIFNTPVASNSLGDRIWYDTNSNGVQDAGEPGVAGVTVTLYASNGTTVIATTVTDANGNYLFTNLPPATDYIIGVLPPAGMIFTTTGGTTAGNATTNSDVNATLGSATYGKSAIVNTGAAGTQILGIDAGVIPQANNTASLGDRVWNDLNSNGTQDAGEPGIAGVTVNLYEDTNGDDVLSGAELVPVRTMTTDAFGNYIFNNLVITATNKWQLEFVQPGGYINTPVANNNSGNDATDSDIINDATDRTAFMRLKFNERNTKIDAGFVQSAPAGALRLGDKVWRDDNGDGQQGATEPGVAGVTVKLYQNGTDGLPGTADDVLIATKTTDVNGSYLFTSLAASAGASTNYNAQFSNIPSGFSFTLQNSGAAATDNNASSLGKSGSINLTVNDLTIDAGIVQGVPGGLGSLGDRVWYDLDNDGIQDAGELGAAGVTVNLYNDVNNDGIISAAELTAVATTSTNALGEYMFGGLAAGNYQVGFTLPAALSTYTLSTKDAGTNDALDSDGNPKNTSIAGNTAGAQTSYTALIPLAQGEDKLTVDLGIVPPAATNTIGGTVWFDTDTDGSQTGNPGRVAGLLVTLYNNAGTAVATTTTDENGDYLFVGLADGDYSVSFTNYPAGFDITGKSATNDATGSDADIISGRTATVTVNAGNRNDRSLDAGLIGARTSLGNRVWEDQDGDGIQDTGEPGVAGVTVTLYDGLSNVIATAITDDNGYYFFPNLTAGNYQVGFTTVPAGMEFTTKDNTTGPDGDGANTWTGGGDSDVNPTGGSATRTDIFALTASQVNLTIDAGVRRTPVATVGNRVWDDVNGNGLQDGGEPGIPGVLATLYNSLNQPIGSAVTDGNGIWLITNVPTGTGYYVIFSNKPLGNFTIQDNGGAGTGGVTDTDTDSDANASGQTGTFDVTPNTLNVKIDAGINYTIVLPIKLISFTAQPQGSNVLLNWVVTDEINVAGYTIEFSTNGTTFNNAGNVAATNSRNYSFVHTAPVIGLNYYRLKSVDRNGDISYSDIRKVNFGKGSSVTVYPNPVKDMVNITLTGPMINKPATISVLSIDGKLLLVQKTVAASQTETVNVNGFAAGKYILQITTANEVINKTITVIH